MNEFCKCKMYPRLTCEVFAFPLKISCGPHVETLVTNKKLELALAVT